MSSTLLTLPAARPAGAPAGKLFELLTGRVGATQGTLAAFDPDLQQSYALTWKEDPQTASGRLRVSGAQAGMLHCGSRPCSTTSKRGARPSKTTHAAPV